MFSFMIWEMEKVLELVFHVVFLLILDIPKANANSLKCVDLYHHAIDQHSKDIHSNLRDYEIVFPEFMDSAGNVISPNDRTRSYSNMQDNIKFIRLTTNEQDFKLDLNHSIQTIDPTLSILTRKNGYQTPYQEITGMRKQGRCLYEGGLISHPGQLAAFSICNGLRGLLRTEYNDYIVEPVERLAEQQLSKRCFPHLLYKASDIISTNTSYFESSNIKGHISSTRRGESVPGLTGLNVKYSKPYGIRQKREIISSKKRIIETLVVVDRAMLEKHKSQNRTDIVSYVLTVMNMVNALFHDSTLDTHLDVSIIGLLLMENDEELNLRHNAKESLNNFCKWQAARSFGFAKRPDHSILLTGKDICIDKDEGCDTMGLARIQGMCIFNETCSINEDTGLGLAFTIAHEIGHSLGMAHDSDGNNCNKREGYVMSPTINSNNGVLSWSSCSRKALKQFLETNQSRCLLELAMNHTGFDMAQVQELPGQMYSPTKQCVLQFGSNYTICTSQYSGNKSYLCKMLWCENHDGTCKTKHLPASEGSRCGDHMWCRRGGCVPFGSNGPQPIHGSWSEFSSWTACSRTCGGGVKRKERKCDSPFPQYGGRQCDGEATVYELCNTFECLDPSTDFRSEQCAKYNAKPYRYQYFKWIPATRRFWKNAARPCALMCEADGFGFSVVLAPLVKDGTRCRDHGNDVCVAGKCERVGCDFRLRSNATEDVCGICNGHNSTCRFVNGSFTGDVSDSDYYFVTKIPKGATNVLIREDQHHERSNAYIAVKDGHEDRYYLNGNWRLDLNGETMFAGTVWKYTKRYGEPETLRTKGPTQKDLTIEALIFHRNPGILYSYYEAYHNDSTIGQQPLMMDYVWHQYLTTCSKECAGGFQHTKLLCRSKNGSDVDQLICSTKTKPKQMSFVCNTQPCKPKWLAGNWSQCEVSCGAGQTKRSVICVQQTIDGYAQVSESRCSDAEQPIRSKACESSVCAYWKKGRWSQCSRSCGRGYRTRTAFCVQDNTTVAETICEGRRPRLRKRCRLDKCRKQYKWVITGWEKCSVTCGEGIQRRRIRCGRETELGSYKTVKKKRCRHLTKPKLSRRRKCHRGKCSPAETLSRTAVPVSKWKTKDWSKCSATCGDGRMMRSVVCLSSDEIGCAHDEKPADIKECNVQPCQLEPHCEDLFSWCDLVTFHKACDHSYFGDRCCKSCLHLKGRRTKVVLAKEA